MILVGGLFCNFFACKVIEQAYKREEIYRTSTDIPAT